MSAEIWFLAVEFQRQRAFAVHVLFENRFPPIGQEVDDFGNHPLVQQGNVSRENERAFVTLLPERVNY